MDWKALFLTVEGRIGRSDYWIGILILVAIGVVAGMVPVLGQLIGFALVYPIGCVFSKRLHDFGKSGWFYLGPIGAGLLLSILAGVLGSVAVDEATPAASTVAGFETVVGLIALIYVVWIAFALWVGLSKGYPGPNRYGPPPISLTGGAVPPPTLT